MSGSAGTLPPFGQHIDDEIFRDLNMVLLGRTGIGKSASGNTILGRQAFKSMKSSTSVTRGVAVESGTVCGQRVTVYDTPGLFHTEMSEDEIQWMYKEVLQRCESGPWVFLLVIKADRFTDKERGTVEKIEELLGEERLKKTWILFTRGDKLEEENMTIEEYIDFSGPLKKVVQKYDQRYHVFNNKTTGSHEQARLLIEKMIHSLKGSGTTSGVIPRSRAKGTDICAINNYYYIIRSDLGCYMKTSDLNEDSDISICRLHPACQNGDHYIGGDSCFHIIKGNSCRRVTDLSTDSSAVVYSLHPNCQGGDHYFAAHKYFYIVFQEKGTLRVTTNMNLDSDAKEHTLHPNFRDGLYYWGLQIKPLSIAVFPLMLFAEEVLSFAGHFCSFFILKPASLWGAQFCAVPDLSKNERTAVYSVHPNVLNFLPGRLSVTKGPVIGMWEIITTIINDSTTPVTWQKKVTKKVGYSKEKMAQITHSWKIAASASIESGELAKLIAKAQFSLSADYGGSHVSTENENWKEATEEEEKLTFELKPKESLYLWQHKLCLGQDPVLFCHNLKITNEPNPPTSPAQP